MRTMRSTTETGLLEVCPPLDLEQFDTQVRESTIIVKAT